MSQANPDRIRAKLAKREEAGALRVLVIKPALIDFCSNDYLSYSHSDLILNHLAKEKLSLADLRSGSGGSRLLSGNTQLAQELEDLIADFHRAESALLFNSGYDANLGLFSCIASRHDTIIYDSLVHASIRDGIRLSDARSFSFAHNDLEDLRAKLSQARGECFVAIESIYSMHGDKAPLREIGQLCLKHGAKLIVDEAHAVGILGEQGRGLVCEMVIEEWAFARVVTFGKALGAHGAAVLGSKLLKNYLVNFSRPFIYSTALPAHSLHCIKAAYALLQSSSMQSQLLYKNIELYLELRANYPELNLSSNFSPIQSMACAGNHAARALSEKLAELGLDLRAILSPTVPLGSERLRISLHAHNSAQELALLFEALKTNAKEGYAEALVCNR